MTNYGLNKQCLQRFIEHKKAGNLFIKQSLRHILQMDTVLKLTAKVSSLNDETPCLT